MLERMKLSSLWRFVFLSTCLCCLFLLEPTRLIAQEISGINLSEINVDDLTDQQIVDYMNQAEEKGYTQQQLEQVARLRGVSEIQITKLRQRISELRLSGNQSSQSTASFESRSNQGFSEEDVFGILLGEKDYFDEKEGSKKVFGLDLFRSNKLTFAPNLNIPTPENYVLGPGDELVIDLWGATQQYWNLKVSPEGAIRPQDLSPVYVNGLTVKQAENKVIDRLGQIYGGLKSTDSEKQNIFYQVSLGNIRTINISVVGEVTAPGNYALNSLSTVFTALYASGGPTENGSFRSVRLLRNNKLEVEVDLYDFLVDGLRPNDMVLKDGDVIVVGLFQGHVEFEGEVKRPGLYEFKEGESFGDLMSDAGGFTGNAFRPFVTINRNGEQGKEVLNITSTDLNDYQLKDGDVVSIRAVQDRYNNRVQIKGAVELEGGYELVEGMTVKALIEKANGLRGDVYLARATIFRMNPDFSQQTFPFDLQKLMSGEIDDILLINEDIVRISTIYELREEYYVEINGEVSLQGVYPYFTNMTIEDLILLAGGLKQGASGAKVEISRRNNLGTSNSLSEIITLNFDKELRLMESEEPVLIEPFDQVFIRRTPNYRFQQKVTIEGEVINPGLFAISRKDERLSDIIKRAGGITPYAYPEGAILIRKTEFAERRGDTELSMDKLIELKEKIVGDTTQTMNEARLQLVERLERLITDQGGQDLLGERVGNRFKKALVEGISEKDTLIQAVQISEQEPTVLELSEVLNNPGSKYDYVIKEGDVISIPSKLETVRIAGEVISPLNLRYDSSFSFIDYVNDAGGFTDKAKKGRTFIQYPNGRTRQTKRFLFFKFYPKIEPGSTIFVAKKPERNKLALQEILAITSTLATLTFLVDRIGN